MNRFKRIIIGLISTLIHISVVILGFMIFMSLYVIPILDNL